MAKYIGSYDDHNQDDNSITDRLEIVLTIKIYDKHIHIIYGHF